MVPCHLPRDNKNEVMPKDVGNVLEYEMFEELIVDNDYADFCQPDKRECK